MNRWPKKPLGEVLDISRERIEPTENPGTLFNYVGLESIEGHTGKLLAYQHTPGAEIKSTKNVFHPGEILYGKLRPYLNKVHLAETDGICSTDIYVLRPNKQQVHPLFAANFLRSPAVLSVVSNAMAGANLPRIGQDSLLAIPIPVPPLAEQDRIVKLLDEADELRKLRAQADTRTAALLPALFHEMFGELAKSHSSWPVVKIGDICEVKGGKRLPKGDEYSEEPTPFRYIRVSDIHEGWVDETALRYLKPETQRQISRYTVKAADLIITIAGTIGVIAPVTPSIAGANLTENAAKLVPRQTNKFDAVFLSELMHTGSVQKQIGLRTGQVTIGKLALFRIEQLSFPLPPLALQREFAQRVTEIREMEAAQAASRQRLESLFQSLLHRAFNGEL